MKSATLSALALLAHWRAEGRSYACYENVPKSKLMMTITNKPIFEKEENGKRHHRVERSCVSSGSVARL
ncbi:MAG: hypothetical protein WCT12_10570 [Verrucomicrobiota bacterium]